MTNNNKETAVEQLREKHLISFPITGADGLDYILTMHAAILELDQRLQAVEAVPPPETHDWRDKRETNQ